VTVPVWVLLAFAIWTLLVVGNTVGLYRWVRMLTGRDDFASWGEYRIEGAGWYKRAMRAHANCVENLPIFGAIVLAGVVAHLDLPVLSVLAVVFMAARVLHTTVHVAFEQTNRVVFCRSMLYHVQWFCMAGMAVVTAWHAAMPA